MSLWVDKYRPDSIAKLSYHEDLTGQLKKLSEVEEVPHLLVYGPSGAGKKTRIHALLKGIFGDGVEKIHIDMRQFTTPSNRKIDISIVSSNFHMELNPSDVGNQDRFVIQTVIKEIAQTQQIDSNSKRKFKVIVISEAESLSKPAQQALRRTMEKYMSNLRIILCCNNTTNIISPIRSRCLLLRVPAPTEEQIINILNDLSRKEVFDLPPQFAKNLVAMSDRNLRKAILILEATLSQTYPVNPSTPIPIPDWELYIKNIANNIIKNQTALTLINCRTMYYELLARCIPPATILKQLTIELFNQVPDSFKLTLLKEATIFDLRIKEGQKYIVHLEGFTAKFMSLYKRFQIELLK
ncbi:P-loop containing nucleoside triphosphate hydrolase protein [Neoconidiobolus thromboides FSU 785]|nr:P-loop containing nucleoside triphosphate hydrolase protein [Neoconidiobolus thromboides FSU 785]